MKVEPPHKKMNFKNIFYNHLEKVIKASWMCITIELIVVKILLSKSN